MNPGAGPGDLRASDADRELVIALLHDAAGDGRLTLSEQSERTDRALAARTLGELVSLTGDLAPPSEQPIRLYGGRAVTAVFARERRRGRWVVPETLPVTAFFGDVVLDCTEAIFQSRRMIIYATAIGGQIRLILPPGIAVEMTGRSFMGARTVSGRRVRRAWSGSGAPGGSGGAGAGTGGVVEVRTLALGGMVKVVTPRQPRRWGWRGD